MGRVGWGGVDGAGVGWGAVGWGGVGWAGAGWLPSSLVVIYQCLQCIVLKVCGELPTLKMDGVKSLW